MLTGNCTIKAVYGNGMTGGYASISLRTSRENFLKDSRPEASTVYEQELVRGKNRTGNARKREKKV